MKRNLLLMMVGLLALSSCSKTEGDEIALTPENVEFTVNFGFAESGSMSRSGASVYDDFYTKYIKTKELTPNNYFLQFKQGDSVIASFDGEWDDIISLPEGTYTVVGTSTTGDSFLSSTASLKFRQEIDVTSSTTNINLTASYDCALFIFDSSELTKAPYYHYNSSMYGDLTYEDSDFVSKGNVYYLFIPYTSFGSRKSIVYQVDNTINAVVIPLEDMTINAGSYYYFGYDSVNNSFDIPPMTAGN